MEKLILKVLLWMNPIFQKNGVNILQLRAILETKLKLDTRRPITFSKINANKSVKNNSFWTIFGYLFIGSIFILILALLDDQYLALSLFLNTYICMLAISLVSDFSTILLDTKDQYIILPKPVNDRTVAFSRICHMGIKLSTQALLIPLPALIFAAFRYNAANWLFLIVQLLLASIFTLFLVNMIYLVFLKTLKIKQFKDAIAIIQIVLTFFLLLGYYFGPSILNYISEKSYAMKDLPALYFLPGTWIASISYTFLTKFSISNIAMTAAGIALPFLGMWSLSNIFSKGFSQKLSALASSDQSESTQSEKTGQIQKEPLSTRLNNVLCSSTLEKAGFNIIWLITARTREFKQQLYPTLAYLPIYFLFLLNNQKNEKTLSEKLNAVSDNGMYIIMFYMTLLTVMTVFQMIMYSSKYKAAWVYYVAPIKNSGEFMTGVLKACLVKFFLPFNLILLIICTYLFGPKIINDMILSTGIGAIEGVIIMLFLIKNYPFSQSSGNNATKKSKILINFLIMGLLGLLGFLHKIIIQYEVLIWILAGITWIIFFIMIRQMKKEKWTMSYSD